MVAAGSKMPDKMFNSLDLYVAGVEGNIPK
jgi:hypothetical protein